MNIFIIILWLLYYYCSAYLFRATHDSELFKLDSTSKKKSVTQWALADFNALSRVYQLKHKTRHVNVLFWKNTDFFPIKDNWVLRMHNKKKIIVKKKFLFVSFLLNIFSLFIIQLTEMLLFFINANIDRYLGSQNSNRVPIKIIGLGMLSFL